ncbi:MAG: PEP-CTERM sorting domain-containing protein [Fimbriimonadaceae bacterium]
MKRLALITFLLAGGLAHAQLIVGNDQSGTATIWEVNVNTGAATALYSSSTTNAKPWGMAADNVNNVLYWNNGTTLFSATYASILSGTPSINSVSITFNGAASSIVGLGYNPATGMLLGTKNIATEAVYEIDPLTGVSTQAYVYNSAFDFGGVDYDAASGELFGLSDTTTGGQGRGLYNIDYVGGSETLVAPYFNNETDVDGLAAANGLAYYVTDGPNTTQVNFYVVDRTTGLLTGTLPSPFTGSGTFSAAAYAPGLVPEPGTMIALGLGAGALLARRRRKPA